MICLQKENGLCEKTYKRTCGRTGEKTKWKQISHQDGSNAFVLHENEINPDPPPGMDVCKLYGQDLPASIVPRRSVSSRLILYHGTSVKNLYGILKNGFVKPTCKQRKECKTGSCKCHMMGQCFYFAGFDKALRHAKQSSFWEARDKGAVIRTAIDPGRWRVQPNQPCSCPCKKPYVDHKGVWMTLFDSIYLETNSLPAVRTNEWCVKSSKQIQIMDYQIYDFQGQEVGPK